MKLYSKNIESKNHTLQTALTRNQVDNLKNQLGFDMGTLSCFYVHASKRMDDRNLDSELIKIKQVENYLEINLNLKLWYRILKIYKVYENAKLDEVIRIVRYYIDNKVSSEEWLQYVLSKELSESINEDILEKLMSMKDDKK